MALFDTEEATALRELFAAMDGVDEVRATSAMTRAATLLRQHDYSFRHIVQEIDTRGLLLPTKVGAAIQLMDSTTLSEAKSAFAGARRLMRHCGLTFAGVIEALDRQPVGADDVEELKLAYKIEVERSREIEAELRKLRVNAAAVAAAAAAAAAAGQVSAVPPARSSFGNFVVVATLLLGVALAASIASTFSATLRPANATATPPVAPVPTAIPTAVERESANSLAPPRAGWNCWRNRGTQGPCF